MGNNIIRIACFMCNTEFRGGVISLYNLLSNYDKSQYEFLYITTSGGEHVDRMKALGVRCHVFSLTIGVLGIGRNRIFRDICKNVFGLILALGTIFRIATFLKEQKVDILHAHDQKSSILGSIIASISGVNLVWHVRDIPFGITSVIDQLFGLLADSIIAVSNTVAQPFVKNKLLKNRTKVVYNSVDSNLFSRQHAKPNEFRRANGMANSFVVGQVANLVPLKGIDYFIRAAYCLKRSGFDGKFVVVGDNKIPQYKGYEHTLTDLVKRFGIQDSFSFIEFCHDVQSVFAALDVFVFTSLGDGFGRVLIEAMSMQVPVIAFDIGASREIIANGVSGILVPPRDVNALAHAIQRLHDDSTLRGIIGEGGYRRVLDDFCVETEWKQIYSVYDRLMKSSDKK